MPALMMSGPTPLNQAVQATTPVAAGGGGMARPLSLDNYLHQTQAGPGLAGMPPSPLVADTAMGGQQPANQNIIGGNLNFAGGGAGLLNGLLGSPEQAMANLGPNYANAYNSALNMNAQNYNNILAGYQQTMDNQNAAQQGITQGYGDLSNSVLGRIAGTDASRRQEIADQYAQSAGTANQSLVNRGLGNTTVTSAVNRGLQLDRAKADTDVANQFAQLQAGYESNIGLAGLNYRNQAVQQNTGLAGQQLDWMNSVNSPYPNSGLYSQLATQFGAGQQGNANRAAIQGNQAQQIAAARDSLQQARASGGGTAIGPVNSGGTRGGGMSPITGGGPGGIGPTPTGGGGPGGPGGRFGNGYGAGGGLSSSNQRYFNSGGLPGSGGAGGDGSGLFGGIMDWAQDPGLFGGIVDWASQQQPGDGYSWGDDGSMYYDASQDFSDNQWAGADQAYYEDPYVGYDAGGYDTSWYDPWGATGGQDYSDGQWAGSDYAYYEDPYAGGYDPSQDYSDGQWAGADWAYYE